MCFVQNSLVEHPESFQERRRMLSSCTALGRGEEPWCNGRALRQTLQSPEKTSEPVDFSSGISLFTHTSIEVSYTPSFTVSDEREKSFGYNSPDCPTSFWMR